MSVVNWLQNQHPSPRQRSQLLSLLSRALRQTGQMPSEARGMVHSQHLHHLCLMALNDFPNHFCEAVSLLLELMEQQSLDPAAWTQLTRAAMVAAVTGDCTLATPAPKEARFGLGGGKVDDWKIMMREFVVKQQLFGIRNVTNANA